jgi:hypothetical protein
MGSGRFHLISGKRGAFNRSMQHHLTVVLKGGVCDRTETNETFSHGEGRHLASLEVPVACADERTSAAIGCLLGSGSNSHP